MPEGITYYDMKRMIEAQVPAGTYKLELHPRWFRSDNKTLINPELIEDLRTRSFEFSGAMVEHWGKALGIPLCDGIWLRVQFALHGHALPATTKEYLSMVRAWDDKSAKAEFKTTVFAAIVGEEMTIIFVDRNRLMTFATINTLNNTIPWYDPKLAPCPIREPDLYEENLERFQHILSSPSRKNGIYKEMTDSSKNNIWNGIGTSHAVEILHLARVHPETLTSDVFNNSEERARLFKAIRKFFQIARSREYCQRVPAGKTSKNAFEFSPSVTRYYNGQFTKVYRKGSTLLSLPIYNELQTNGLLASTAKELEYGWETMVTKGGKEKKKRVPVYTIQMSTNNKDTTKLIGDGEEFPKIKPNAENKKGKSIYTYTCIYKQPPAAKGAILEEKVAVKKRLQDGGNTAEIGIASFMDTIKEIKKRKLDTKKTAHRVSVREGKIGRPIKRKKTESELRGIGRF